MATKLRKSRKIVKGGVRQHPDEAFDLIAKRHRGELAGGVPYSVVALENMKLRARILKVTDGKLFPWFSDLTKAAMLDWTTTSMFTIAGTREVKNLTRLTSKPLSQLMLLAPMLYMDILRYMIATNWPTIKASFLTFVPTSQAKIMQTRGLQIRETKRQFDLLSDVYCPVIFPDDTPADILKRFQVQRHPLYEMLLYSPEDDEALLAIDYL